MNILIIAKNTFKEAVRNKIIYSTFLFFSLLVIVSAIFGSVTLGDKVKVIKDFGLFGISFFASILTIINGVNLLNKEIKQKTIYNILSKPVKREEFIIGKYLGLTLTTLSIVSIMSIALVFFTYYFENIFDFQIFKITFFIFLEVLIVGAITIFFSSLIVTTSLAGVFTFSTYLAGRSINYLSYFINQEKSNNEALKSIIKIFDLILPDLNRLNIIDSINSNLVISGNYIIHSILYTASYLIAILILSILIFNRREFK